MELGWTIWYTHDDLRVSYEDFLRFVEWICCKEQSLKTEMDANGEFEEYFDIFWH